MTDRRLVKYYVTIVLSTVAVTLYLISRFTGNETYKAVFTFVIYGEYIWFILGVVGGDIAECIKRLERQLRPNIDICNDKARHELNIYNNMWFFVVTGGLLLVVGSALLKLNASNVTTVAITLAVVALTFGIYMARFVRIKRKFGTKLEH